MTATTMIWREDERREGGEYRFKIEKWRELVMSFAARPRVYQRMGYCLPPEIFLCLREGHLAERYNRELLESLLRIARDYSWGGDIYLAADESIGFFPQRIVNRAGLSAWLDLAIKGGVADLIEVGFDRNSDDPIDERNLRDGADLSSDWRKVLWKMMAGGRWKCYFPGDVTNLFHLLGRFAASAEERKEAGEMITVLDKVATSDQLGLVKIACRKYPQARQVIALCDEPDLRRSSGLTARKLRELEKYCRENGLDLIRFRGPFELLYFLLRLDKQEKLPVWEDSLGQRIGKVVGVPLADKPLFNQTRNAGSQSKPEGRSAALITSCFDEPGHCYQASRDAGLMRSILPAAAIYRVRPNLESRVLPDLLRAIFEDPLDSASALIAWLYLGHGHKEDGLQSGAVWERETAEQWLQRFDGYQRSLSVVFFAACRSDAVARRFAEAGVGLAIGFEDDVQPEACQLLAEKVLSAALHYDGERGIILAAYEQGCRELNSRSYGQTNPVAFYPVPKVQ